MIVICVVCGKRVRAKKAAHSQKYCKLCAVEAQKRRDREFRNSPKGRKYKKRIQQRYGLTGECRGKKRENSWRFQGIINLTWEKWEKDVNKGCMFKFLGNCAGTLGADHNHDTGLYRGPLCIRHNKGIAALGDRIETLEAIVRILRDRSV